MQLALMALVMTVLSASGFSASTLTIADPRAAKIEAIIPLPITGMSAVQSDGQIYFISSNGRFVISGQIYDLWHKKSLDTLVQIRDVSERLNLKEMGMDFRRMNSLSLGHGPHEAVIFVDPRCHICHQLIAEAKPLADQYTFHIVVIPALVTVHPQGIDRKIMRRSSLDPHLSLV